MPHPSGRRKPLCPVALCAIKRAPQALQPRPPMNATSPARSSHQPRVEDDALVRGNGRFMDDPRLPNQAYAAFVRSPHAHASVHKVDISAARAAKHVLGVFTAEDMKAGGVGSIARHPPVVGRGGVKMPMPFRPALAGDKVMHGGDPVAMVVAETAAAIVRVERVRPRRAKNFRSFSRARATRSRVWSRSPPVHCPMVRSAREGRVPHLLRPDARFSRSCYAEGGIGATTSE